MADLRTFLDVTEALRRLSLRHGTDEVTAVARDWVAYIDRVQAIIERHQVPDDPAGLDGQVAPDA